MEITKLYFQFNVLVQVSTSSSRTLNLIESSTHTASVLLYIISKILVENYFTIKCSSLCATADFIKCEKSINLFAQKNIHLMKTCENENGEIFYEKILQRQTYF
jgi:hypothetical protein